MASVPNSIKTLRRYAREHPASEKLAELLIGLQEESSDRAATIAIISILEGALEAALRKHLAPISDDDAKDLFESDGLFSSFGAKIKMGFIFKLYGSETREVLDCIRELRNAFAHTRGGISFETREVANVCARMNYNRTEKQSPAARQWWADHPRDNLLHTATILALYMDDYAEGRRTEGLKDHIAE